MKSIIIICLITTFIQIGKGIALDDSLQQKALNIERLIFDNAQDKYLMNELLLEKAVLYRVNKEYTFAIKTLKRVDHRSDSIHFDRVQYELAVNSYLQKNYINAFYYFQQLDSVFLHKQDETVLLKMVLLLEKNLISEFQSYYLSCLQIKDSALANDFKKSFQPEVQKDPNYYKKLSSILPGLGLLKSKNIGKGLMNLSLEIAFASFAIYNFYNGYIFSGIFSGVYPFYRFYNGGKVLTVSTVEKYNNQLSEALKLKGYKFIQSFVTLK